MRKELGKWLMDIAKYITTAILLTSFISDLSDKTAIYILSAIAVVLSLSFGLYLINDNNSSNANCNNKTKKKE